MISDTEKRCSNCGLVKPATLDFFYFTRGRPNGRCKACQRSPEERQRVRDYMRQVRLDALTIYGGECACCGEAATEFLGIDHIEGGGTEHRRELTRQGTTLYLWLRKHGYPEGFRVLCHNCNLAIGFYGACPHQIKT
jgi:hypothetical protein